ncbi:hypothetical protein GCM10023186_15920 [Hymenobacter koreensis]|uniref:Uncharacterized protein n=1 Tax=Hymenobacter koreensis TaxID=1084523 RepID=A0ABP8IYH5_9BACT
MAAGQQGYQYFIKHFGLTHNGFADFLAQAGEFIEEAVEVGFGQGK